MEKAKRKLRESSTKFGDYNSAKLLLPAHELHALQKKCQLATKNF